MRNLLIDQKLERAALVESEEDAMRLMRGPLGSRKIVTAAWSTEGSKAYHRRAGPHCRTQLCVCSSPATIRDCAQEMCACCACMSQALALPCTGGSCSTYMPVATPCLC